MNKKSVREHSTLEQLEGDAWGEPTYDSHLVTECHRLRRVSIGELTIENLRILIGQDIGLQFLIPIALRKLFDDPLAEGDYYPGDLLCAVLRVDPKFWAGNKAIHDQAGSAARQALGLVDTEEKTVIRAIREAMDKFSAAPPPASGVGRCSSKVS